MQHIFKTIKLQRANSNLLSVISVISLIVLSTMMFLPIQPVLADDCTAYHIAVAVARAAVELAKENRDLASEAVDNAQDFGELILAGVWLASAEWVLNRAEADHDDALQDLQDCLNPPCPCGCGIEGCDTCGDHASSGSNSSCSGG